MIHQQLWQRIRRIGKSNSKSEVKQRDNFDEEKPQIIRNADIDDRDAASSTPNTNTIKIITDEPTLEDALDFDNYSKELADIIRNSSPSDLLSEFSEDGEQERLL